MQIEKRVVQISAAVFGIIYRLTISYFIKYITIGTAMMHSGVKVNYNESLKIFNMAENVSYFYVYSGGLMLLTSGIGWVAAQSKSEPLSFLYGYLSLLILLLFTSISFVFLIARGHIGKTIEDGCTTDTGFYSDIEFIYQQGSSILCTASCPCTGSVGVTDPYGANTLLECPGGSQVYSPAMQEKYGKWLTLFETQLKCSGLCQYVGYFLFAGTNTGVPVANCQDAIVSTAEDNFGWYAGWSLFYGLIGLCTLITSVGIFYVERKTFVPESFYKYSKWGLKE